MGPIAKTNTLKETQADCVWGQDMVLPDKTKSKAQVDYEWGQGIDLPVQTNTHTESVCFFGEALQVSYGTFHTQKPQTSIVLRNTMIFLNKSLLTGAHL